MRKMIDSFKKTGLLLIFCSLTLPVSAAPITYGFDATITNVPTGVPFDLPLSFSVGDKVFGRFAFEPQTGSSTEVRREYSQSGELLVIVDGVELRSSGFAIEVHNNEGFIDAPFQGADLIDVGCSYPTLSTICDPEVVNLGSGESFRLRQFIRLLGTTDILSDTSIPSDVYVWNDLDIDRFIQVNFDNLGPGSLGFIGEVHNLRIIPEPTCLILCMPFFAAGFKIISRNF